jgi:hypothetical protein
MTGLFVITTICSFTGLVPALYAIIKYKLINEEHRFFVFYLIVGCAVDIIGRLSLIFRYLIFARELSNFYILFEGIIFLILFYKWSALKRTSFIIFLFLIFVSWVLDNYYLKSFDDSCSMYRIFYSIIIVLLSIKLVQQVNLNQRASILKDPLSLISITLIFNFSYRSVFESLYLFKLGFSNNFYLSAYLIFITFNVISNCTYTYAIHCMGLRKRLSSFY